MPDANPVTAPVALTPAERQRQRRARQKAGEQAPTCQGCGCPLRAGAGGSEARLTAGLCRACWLQTPEGAEIERQRVATKELTDQARARKRAWAAADRAKKRAEKAGKPEG